MNRMKKKLSCVLLATLIITNCNMVKALESGIKPLELSAKTTVANMDMVIKDNFVKAKYASAENRFIQSNVKASYNDFEDLVQRAVNDDYVFLVYGIKMAEYGFFDLSETLFNKLDANEFTKLYINDIKKFYYPSAMVNKKDVVYLADAYSNIVYNNTLFHNFRFHQRSSPDLVHQFVATQFSVSKCQPIP